ncbi:MAG: hypothetical protein ABIS26_01380, partial [Candidatus Paceibacterota bacterium]
VMTTTMTKSRKKMERVTHGISIYHAFEFLIASPGNPSRLARPKTQRNLKFLFIYQVLAKLRFPGTL